LKNGSLKRSSAVFTMLFPFQANKLIYPPFGQVLNCSIVNEQFKDLLRSIGHGKGLPTLIEHPYSAIRLLKATACIMTEHLIIPEYGILVK
jgi:hypothetical protein